MEFANILTQAKSAAELLKTGAITELSINSEKVITLMRLVSPEYFLVLALKPTGNYGKGRYVLRLAAPKVMAWVDTLALVAAGQGDGCHGGCDRYVRIS